MIFYIFHICLLMFNDFHSFSCFFLVFIEKHSMLVELILDVSHANAVESRSHLLVLGVELRVHPIQEILNFSTFADKQVTRRTSCRRPRDGSPMFVGALRNRPLVFAPLARRRCASVCTFAQPRAPVPHR